MRFGSSAHDGYAQQPGDGLSLGACPQIRTVVGESPLGLPADFLLDPTGLIKAVKYGEHAYDQWEVDEVIALAARVRPR